MKFDGLMTSSPPGDSSSSGSSTFPTDSVSFASNVGSVSVDSGAAASSFFPLSAFDFSSKDADADASTGDSDPDAVASAPLARSSVASV